MLTRMSKKQAATKSTAPEATVKPSRAGWIGAVVLLAVLLAGAGAAGYALGLRNAPLGSPLPPKSKPLIQTAGVEIKDSSTLKLQISAKVLDKLAPQPDGTAPLDLLLPSERGEYAQVFPFGSQIVNLPDDVYNKSRMDAQVTFKYGQPLFLMNALITPRKGAESYRAAAQRMLADAISKGATTAGASDVTAAKGCPFSQFAYVCQDADGEQEFRDVFVSPFGDYLLVFDCMAKAKYKAQAQAQAAKIIASFDTKRLPAERFKPQDAAGAAPAR
jgi:hypothetical protein